MDHLSVLEGVPHVLGEMLEPPKSVLYPGSQATDLCPPQVKGGGWPSHWWGAL